MSANTKDPALADHLAWLGYVQPEGLVVSAPALVDAQAIIDRAQLAGLQRGFAEHVTSLRLLESDTSDTRPGIENLQLLVTAFLGWPYESLAGVDPSCPLPESLRISLPEFQETLRPSFAVKNPHPKEGASPWLLLVQSHPATVDLDKPAASSERQWHASPAKKFERLLRETGVPIGLLANGTQLRLVYAPPKENSGSLAFPVGAMTEVSGRLILGAFHLLLGSWTLFTGPGDARLPALLQRSRDYQASVSELLAEQVLHALYELLRGFEAADDRAQGTLLRQLAARSPADIYGGLVTVLLRLVFILFAEDRGLLPASGLYVRHYSVRGLFERLRADAERYPDTMDHRFGAWAQLLALFRVIYGGCRHPELKMPARAGHLFDPDRYPFLEGRSPSADRSPFTDHRSLPLVSDGSIHRILEKLCVLQGERVSYRTLDVEEIGSVYQTIMGFAVETADGTAIALKGKRKNGGIPAAPVITLEHLLAVPAKDRAKWLKEHADTDLAGEADKTLKSANAVDDLLVALQKRIDRNATPAPVAQGGLLLQPTDERRRSGSHYTPRSFTEPIVRKTLEPILKRLAEDGERLTVNSERRGGGQDGERLTVNGGRGGERLTVNSERRDGEQDGEQRTGNGEPNGGRSLFTANRSPHNSSNENRVVSGPEGLAGGSSPCRAGVSGDTEPSLGGEVRADLADAPGSGVHPVEHCRGLGAALPGGVHPVSSDRERQSGGAGNPVDPHGGLSTPAGISGGAPSAGLPESGPPNPGAGTEHQGANSEQLTVNSGDGSDTVHRSPFTVHPPPRPEAILSLKICDIAVGSAAFLVETCRQLADELVRAWRTHGGRPDLPPDETEELLAMRLIAQRCLYGVDRNPMAVDLAKLSLWLATLAKDHPFTFLDHSIRCGDSLVGFTREQLARFHWDGQSRIEQELGQQWIEKDIRTATAARVAILNERTDTPESVRRKLDQLGRADDALDQPRLMGKLLAAAWFGADTNKGRTERREEMLQLALGWMRKRERGLDVMNVVKSLESGPFPVRPFNWEIEFPEVFQRENPGFDGIVGNPPFAGKNTLLNSNREGYIDWLKTLHEESHGNADLVAHFFRRAFDLLRRDGCFGLIATNTIGQGDTRATGLRWLCTHGGTVYSARKRHKWPGQAAVVVSVLWTAKGRFAGPFDLDGRSVPFISAYLFHAGGHGNPAVLRANGSKSFIGSYVLGMGFTFDDTDKNGAATPLAVMRELMAKDPRNADRIYPYLGGEEVNDSPDHKHHRYVINFGELSESEARRWPDLMGVVERKVRPEREAQNREIRKRYWWRFGETTPALAGAMHSRSRMLAVSRVSQHNGFAFLPTDIVVAETLVLFMFESHSAFSLLQSRSHEVWARFFGSSLEERPRYAPSDCFETFPFPVAWETNADLEAVGQEYYDFRAALMVRNNEGLTKTYNRFHDPEERSPDIQTLRDLHARMDAAVLAAYGWTDIPTACEFILDYEEEADGESPHRSPFTADRSPQLSPLTVDRSPSLPPPRSRARKRPWRYRWPDEVRDEVLARLLKLNAERAEEEKLAGVAAARQVRPVVPTARPKKAVAQIPRSPGINFTRGAIAAYAVDRLSHRPEFGRTQLEKALYGAQEVLGVNLEMEFEAFAAGPFDKEIHKLESLAAKQKWFYAVPREGGKGTAYRRGSRIQDRCGAANAILGAKRAEFDRILHYMGKMNSEQAGVWTTVHSVWNKLILAGEQVTDDGIVNAFYEFHVAKAAIEEHRVRVCIQWLRAHNLVPRGIRFGPRLAESPQGELFK